VNSDELRSIVDREFGAHSKRFKPVEMLLIDALAIPTPRVGRGVYVHLCRRGVVRVGKSSSRDACSRAIEHVRDDTGGQMACLRDDPSAKLMFFVADSKDEHWIVALETYLERELAPLVPARRRP
jgi:hypothetical protein